MAINFAEELNEEQLAAVQAGDGPVLVIAAAGTGKTRTLVYRVAWLVENGCPGERILLLTFTNKAAREMMDRARELVGQGVSGMWGGTFHHVANRMLRKHAEILDYRRDYTILDSDDAKSLAKAVIEELGHKGNKEFPKAEVLLSLFSLAANKDEDPDALLEERFGEHRVDTSDLRQVYDAYVDRKRKLNAMDFDDLLINATRLLEENETLASYYQDLFQYVLVDEYQDTNPVQARFVNLLAAKHRNLLVVGDDFQSIYSWRGADYRNIINFPERYPEAQSYELVTNYRSSPEILAVANRCIAGNPEQFQKQLLATREQLGRPHVLQLLNGQDQARAIIDRIHEMRRRGYKYSDMAVLYRSHFHAMELQLALNKDSVPHLITSGVRFFEQAHIKDVLALLRLAHNPVDELAFARLLCLLPGVGAKGALRMWTKLGYRFDIGSSEHRNALMSGFPKRGKEFWEKINRVLEEIEREELKRNPGEMIQRYMNAFYDEFAVNNFDNYPRRLEDINGMIDYTAQFADLAQFLNELALQTNMDELTAEEQDDGNAVRLTTVHQAKGLEYPVVFILWCVDGMFPSGRSLEESDSGGESEERRLFYVAATRAMDHLFFGVPKARRNRDGSMQFYTPSRFIGELGHDLLEEKQVRASWY